MLKRKKVTRGSYVKVATPWREFCDRNGLKYGWVADQLGITRALMGRWLQGKETPQGNAAASVSVFAERYGSSLEEVFPCD